MSSSQEKTEAAPPELVRDSFVAVPESGFLGRWTQRVGIVFAIGIFCSAVVLFFEVVMRYVFNQPTIWAHETVTFLSATAFVFGGLFVAAQDKHIRVVLIYNMLSDKARRIMNILISIICMIASGFFSWASWSSVKRAVWTPQGDIHLETSGSAWNPPFPGIMKVFLFVILIALTLQFLIFAINFARNKAAN